MLIDAVVTKLSCDLVELVSKGTASYVSEKVKAMESNKDISNIRNTYDELLSKLLQERSEAIRIAQAYKDELEKVSISDKDIEYLHKTVSSLLRVLSHYNIDSKNALFSEDMANSINELISKDVLKSMQLLGFNYKEAIGEPLTKLCADKISSFASSKVRTRK